MTVGETWDVPALLAALRCAEPYHGLTRHQLDDVLEMLDGRHRGRVVPELRALVSLDAVEGTVRARPGAERALYRGGGTIPDRGYFHLRRAGTGAKIGELDEEFVWERKLGDAFTLGVQGWRIEEITHNDVLVSPAAGPAAMAPFWRADDRDRGAFLSARIASFLSEIEPRLDDPALPERLARESGLTPGAASALVELLRAQRRATGALPHAERIVAERIAEGTVGDGAEQLVLHACWGGRVLRPLAVALEAAWRRRHGTQLEIVVDDDALAVTAPAGTRARDLFALVEPAQLEALLREGLGATGFLGARFREAAGTALQLPRQGFGRRTPLWFTRQRAKQLLDRVTRLPEFPLVVEAWRSALADHFDLPRLRELLAEVHAGRIAIHESATRQPSPFAADVAWRRVNTLMYESDTPSGHGAAPAAGLLRELVHAGALRPRVPRRVADTFQRKAQRLWPGYAPAGSRELLDWLRERSVVPLAEWEELLEAAARAADRAPEEVLGEIAGKIAAVTPPGVTGPRFVAALEALPRIATAAGWDPRTIGLAPLAAGTNAAALRRTLGRLTNAAGGAAPPPGADPLADLLADLLRYFGPVSPAALAEPLALDDAGLRDALESLEAAGRAVVDAITEDAAEPQLCDADNLERLLRIARAARRPVVAPLPLARLPGFLAAWQGVAGAGSSAAAPQLGGVVEQLAGLPLPAALWESDVLPLRVPGYEPALLDALLAAGEVEWSGAGEKRIAFAPGGERELFVETEGGAGGAADGGAAAEAARARLAALFPDVLGRYPLEALAQRAGLTTAEATRRLWALAWDGLATSDGFAAVRAGLASGFSPAEPHGGAGAPAAAPSARGPTPFPSRRLRFGTWRATRAFGGLWSPLFPPDPPADALERDERDRERARVLLHRYGVVFRELTAREPAVLSWGRLFRALRLLELSGEAVSGQFFEGIAGAQFALSDALDALLAGAGGEGSFFHSAADPAATTGLGLAGLPDGLPRRVPGNHVAFAAGRLVAASERRGRALAIFASPDDSAAGAVLLDLLRFLAGQRVGRSGVVIETIDGRPAVESAWAAVLGEAFHKTRDGGALRLVRRS